MIRRFQDLDINDLLIDESLYVPRTHSNSSKSSSARSNHTTEHHNNHSTNYDDDFDEESPTKMSQSSPHNLLSNTRNNSHNSIDQDQNDWRSHSYHEDFVDQSSIDLESTEKDEVPKEKVSTIASNITSADVQYKSVEGLSSQSFGLTYDETKSYDKTRLKSSKVNESNSNNSLMMYNFPPSQLPPQSVDMNNPNPYQNISNHNIIPVKNPLISKRKVYSTVRVVDNRMEIPFLDKKYLQINPESEYVTRSELRDMVTKLIQTSHPTRSFTDYVPSSTDHVPLTPLPTAKTQALLEALQLKKQLDSCRILHIPNYDRYYEIGFQIEQLLDEEKDRRTSRDTRPTPQGLDQKPKSGMNINDGPFPTKPKQNKPSSSSSLPPNATLSTAAPNPMDGKDQVKNFKSETYSSYQKLMERQEKVAKSRALMKKLEGIVPFVCTKTTQNQSHHVNAILPSHNHRVKPTVDGETVLTEEEEVNHQSKILVNHVPETAFHRPTGMDPARGTVRPDSAIRGGFSGKDLNYPQSTNDLGGLDVEDVREKSSSQRAQQRYDNELHKQNLVKQVAQHPEIAQKCDRLYSTFLSDLIKNCRKRSSAASTLEELVMHRVLSEKVQEAFAAETISNIQSDMISTALQSGRI